MKFTLKEFAYSQILCLGILQQDFGIGFPSPSLSELLKLGLLDETSYPIFTSLFVVGLALGPIISIPGSKYLGRKLVIILSSLPNALGLLLIAGASNSGYLFTGRLFHGIGAGMLVTVIPVYLGEITPPTGRGFLISFLGAYDILGLLLVYIFGIILSFRWLAIVGVVISLLQTFAMLIVPQSATWLYSRGLEKRAKCVLEGLRRNGENVLEECTAIQTALDTKRVTTVSMFYYMKFILTKYRLKALAVGIILALGSTNTGIDIVYSYTSPLLEGSGGIDPNILAIVVPIFGVLGGILAIMLVEPFGRKPLLLTSAIIVTGSLVSLACYFLSDEYIFGCSVHEEDLSSVNEYVCNWLIIWPGISLVVFSCTIRIGWGSIVYIMMGEVFPIRLREFGPGILQCILNMHSIFVLTTFPYIAGVIGKGFTFLILVIANVITCIFIVLFLPETKSLKADEIEEIFQENTLLCGLDCGSYSYNVEV